MTKTTSQQESEQVVMAKLRAWAKAKASIHKYVTAYDINEKEDELLDAIAGHDYAFRGEYHG